MAALRTVLHDLTRQEFYLLLDANGKSTTAARATKAVLQYHYDATTNVADLFHTEVPPKYKGQGIGYELAVAAFEHFFTMPSHPRMMLSCTFLRDAALPKHPKYLPIIVLP